MQGTYFADGIDGLIEWPDASLCEIEEYGAEEIPEVAHDRDARFAGRRTAPGNRQRHSVRVCRAEGGACIPCVNDANGS